MKKIASTLLIVFTLCFSANLLQAQQQVVTTNAALTPENVATIEAMTTEVPIMDPNIAVIEKFYSNYKNKTVLDTAKGTLFTLECITSQNTQTKIVRIELSKKSKQSGRYCNPEIIILIKEINKPWYTQGLHKNHTEYISAMLAQTVAYLEQ